MMKSEEIFEEIQRILDKVKDDQIKLQEILTFLNEEIDEETDEFDQPELSDKFANLVREIAGSIDAGFVCFVNIDTFETEEIPKEMMNDPDEFEAVTGESIENLKFKYPEWERCLTFEPLESDESFKIMRKFTDFLEDRELQNQLENAFINSNPFANFKFIIENSAYLYDWINFKKNYIENYIKDFLLLELGQQNQESYSGEMNGFYDKSGNKIDPDSVPVPNLCVICKSHETDGGEENLLCLINRFDQRNDTDFKCGAFENIN